MLDRLVAPAVLVVANEVRRVSTEGDQIGGRFVGQVSRDDLVVDRHLGVGHYGRDMLRRVVEFDEIVVPEEHDGLVGGSHG